jgi:hypothetical protein
MTQHYALLIFLFFCLKKVSVFYIAFFIPVVLHSVQYCLLFVFMLLFGVNTSQQKASSFFSNRIFKAQVSFTNHYLSYDFSSGIGGGGGGHGGSISGIQCL